MAATIYGQKKQAADNTMTKLHIKDEFVASDMIQTRPNIQSGDQRAQNTGRPLTILVIEPRAFFRDCIVKSLKHEKDFEVLSVGSIAEAQTLPNRSCVSLVLVSCDDDQTDNITKTSQLKDLTQEVPSAAIVLVSDGRRVDNVIAAVSSGARGVIPHDTTLSVAIGALRLVHTGGTYVPVSSLMASHKNNADNAKDASSADRIFTAKQVQVLHALRKGKANKAIAYELNMCESTVKVHVRNIMKRLKAKNRTEVAYLAGKLLVKDEPQPNGADQ